MSRTILFHNQKRMSTVKHLVVDCIIKLKKLSSQYEARDTLANASTQISYSPTPTRICEFKTTRRERKKTGLINHGKSISLSEP